MTERTIGIFNTSMRVIFRYRYFIIAFAMIMLTGDTCAQPPPPGGGGPSCWPPPCIPIDGGISWLLAAGVIYGAKKSFDLGKNKK